MTLEEATALAGSINRRSSRYLAAPYDVGSFALVLLEIHANGPSRSPIVDVARYLALMEQKSPAVENDSGLQEILRQVLLERQPDKATAQTQQRPEDQTRLRGVAASDELSAIRRD